MRIYTKFGDKGQTSLLGGGIVPKNDKRVEAYGSIDELNAVLGIAISFCEIEEITHSLKKIQKDLFEIGAELATSDAKTRKISPQRVGEIEHEIDNIQLSLTPLNHFILPGGSKSASLLHLARTVCRRAERRIVELSEKEDVNPDIMIYLNRVGDLLFVHARYANWKKKVDEVIWKGF